MLLPSFHVIHNFGLHVGLKVAELTKVLVPQVAFVNAGLVHFHGAFWAFVIAKLAFHNSRTFCFRCFKTGHGLFVGGIHMQIQFF